MCELRVQQVPEYFDILSTESNLQTAEYQIFESPNKNLDTRQLPTFKHVSQDATH